MSGRNIFNIKYTPERVFEIILDNFSFSAAWYQTLKIKRIKFTIAQTSQLSRIINTLSIKKVKLTAGTGFPKLLQNLPMELVIKKIKLTAIWKELYKIVQTVSIKKIKFVTTLRQLLRITTANIAIKKIKIIATATVAVFYTLSYWDTYYLSDLDAYNLSDMDFVA
jgi:hypothetical protein